MSLIIENKDRFNKGYFISNPKKETFSIFKANEFFFITQEGNVAIKNEILGLIRNCKKVIKICSFILTDPEIFELLLEKAKESAIAIFILTQYDNDKLRRASIIDDLIEDGYESSEEQHMSIIKSLYDHGAHVRAATITHAKFLIADQKFAFITSANITTPSLNLNTESGIYLNEYDALNLDRLFDIIFQKGTQYIHFVTANKTTAKKGRDFIVQSSANLLQKDIDLIGKETGLRFTYEGLENGLYKQILEIINTSKEYLYLSSFCIVGLDSLPGFKNAIEDAINRNVEILLFCRGMNYRGDHLESCEWLFNVGCNLYGDIYNHSKGVANEVIGLIFTANIDGRHGLTNGFEVGCLLSDEQRAKFVEFHKTIIAQSDFIYQSKPIRKEFLDTYLYYQEKKGIVKNQFAGQMIIKSDRPKLLSDTRIFDNPIFYAEKDGRSYLAIGDDLFLTVYENGIFSILDKSKPDRTVEKSILNYETLIIN